MPQMKALSSTHNTPHTTHRLAHTTHTHTPHGIWQTHTHTIHHTHNNPSPHTHTHTQTRRANHANHTHTHTHSSDYPQFCQTNNFGTVEWVNKTNFICCPCYPKFNTFLQKNKKNNVNNYYCNFTGQTTFCCWNNRWTFAVYIRLYTPV